MQLFAFQAYQRAQTHVDDGRGLTVAEPETLHKARFGRIRGLRRTDYVNHLVDVVLGYEQAFQYVRPLLSLAQVEARTAHHHLVAMFYEVAYLILERERHGASVHQSYTIDGERRL